MKAKFYLAALALTGLLFQTNAQQQHADWMKQVATEHTNSNINNILFDGENYFVNGGYFTEGTFNGIELQEALGANTFVSKMDADGNNIWLTGIYGDDIVSFFDMTFDADNNVVLTGWTTAQEAVYVDGEMVIEGDGTWVNRSMVMKLSGEDGSLMWFRHWAGEEYTTLNTTKLTVDEDNNVYVAGYYNAPFEIDGFSFPFEFTFGDDIFILKFDTEGNVAWGNYWPSIDNMGFSTIRTMDVNDDALYFSMEYSLPVIVNGEELPYSGEYYWVAVAKASKETGEVLNIYPFGTEQGQLIQKLVTDNDGNIIVSGWFTAEAPITIGDFTLNGYGYNDGFIFKMNSDLEVLWAKDMGGEFTDRAFNLQVNDDNSILLGGGFSTDVVFNYDGMQVLDSSDPFSLGAFYLELDANGNFIQSTGLYGDSEGTTLSFTDASAVVNGNNLDVYCTGNFNGTVEFVEGETIVTDHNQGYLYKWTLPYLVSVDNNANEAFISVYPNPTADMVSINTENQKADFSIFAMDGSLVEQGIIDGSGKISLLQLPAGVYILKVEGDRTSQTAKIIKN